MVVLPARVLRKAKPGEKKLFFFIWKNDLDHLPQTLGN